MRAASRRDHARPFTEPPRAKLAHLAHAPGRYEATAGPESGLFHQLPVWLAGSGRLLLRKDPCQLGAVVHPELLVAAAEMRLDCLRAQEELRAGRLDARALGDDQRDPQLLRSQPLQTGPAAFAPGREAGGQQFLSSPVRPGPGSFGGAD